MKTEFLTGLGLEKDVIDQIMAENGKDINAAKEAATEELATTKEEPKQTKEQLETANATIDGFKMMTILKHRWRITKPNMNRPKPTSRKFRWMMRSTVNLKPQPKRPARGRRRLFQSFENRGASANMQMMR
jgi:hypothetical protein